MNSNKFAKLFKECLDLGMIKIIAHNDTMEGEEPNILVEIYVSTEHGTDVTKFDSQDAFK